MESVSLHRSKNGVIEIDMPSDIKLDRYYITIINGKIILKPRELKLSPDVINKMTMPLFSGYTSSR